LPKNKDEYSVILVNKRQR